MHRLDICNKRDSLIVDEFAKLYPKIMKQIRESTQPMPLQRLYVSEIKKRYPMLYRLLEIEKRSQLGRWEDAMKNRINYLGGVM